MVALQVLITVILVPHYEVLNFTNKKEIEFCCCHVIYMHVYIDQAFKNIVLAMCDKVNSAGSDYSNLSVTP